ncbi:MAG: TRAP transporter TatT component family protein [Gammaproteobacteria bacterium]|nr:TRAP transporter TatT component family protein [Gammaproteobacteria bacterium]
MNLTLLIKSALISGWLCVQILLGGCATLMSAATSRMADDLTATILNSDDPETVRAAVPAYLLLIESLLRGSPDNENILRAAASLNGAFAGAFVEDESRAALLAEKSLNYAFRALCIHRHSFCEMQQLSFEQFQQIMSKAQKRDLEALYSVGIAWTGWIQTHGSDWNAIAQLPRVRLIMETLIRLDETWDNGGPHLYMGGLDTLLPASMGGKPEAGRAHFERAIELSRGRHLMTKVVYAEQYCRLVFNKELHDRLLREVLDADPVAPGMTLINMVAQVRARALLEESDDYF